MTAYIAPFQYNATVLYVHDGDSLDVDVDYGFFLHQTPTTVRILGINAAELKTPGGDAAGANLKALLPPGTPVVLTTAKPDKYAPRWDASITYLVSGQPHDLATDLIAAQWAAAWDGKGTKPVPPWPRVVAA